MRRVLPLAVLLTFFISNTFYSQVVIKEKVGIKPKINSVSKSLAQHIIRVDLQWDPIDVPAAIIDYSDTHYYPCRSTGGTDWETGGNLSYQIIDVVGGNYNIQFRFGPPCNGQEEHARYSIYYDNDSVTAGTFTIEGCFSLGGFPHYNLVYKSPLITDYSFQIYPKNLCIGEKGSVYYELGWDCTNVEIDTSVDNLNLQITSGDEFVSFYRNGQPQGDNLTIPFSETDDIDIIQDQFYSGNEIIVKLKSSLGYLIKYDSLLIYPKNRYKIAASECTYPLLYDEDFYMEVHIEGPGGCLAKLPPGITLNAQIVKGNDLGYLQDLDNGTTGDTLNNIPLQSNGKNHLKFISSGEMKANMDTAFIKFSISDEEINDLYLPVIFTPGPLVIDIQPPTLSPGETATITLKKRLLDGTIVDFDSTQTFEIGIMDGCILGNIVADNDTGAYFYDVPQPIKFVADTAKGNNGEVKLRIAAVYDIILMNTKKNDKNKEGILTSKSDSNKNSGKNYDKTTSFCFVGNFRMNDASDAKIKIGSDIDTILLGETKYYQARYDSLLNKLLIEEIKSGSDGIPKLNDGLASDVWGNNPVSIDTGKNYGKRMGVYWETEKPVWDGNINKGNLEKGLIRLIGRYWSKDSTYIVELKAKKNNDSAKFKIMVIKPGKLLSEDQSPTYSKSIDVFDKEYSIDSLCIYWGGLYGIPPQLIKGHIEKEAPPTNFLGYTGFAPSYRYEPYTTQFNDDVKNLIDNNNPFVVTNKAMGVLGATKVPTETEHDNVLYIHYPQSPKTVWEFIDENSQLTKNDNPSTFGYRYNGTPPDERKKGQMHSSSYKIINKKYKQKLSITDFFIRKKYKVKDPDKLTLSQQIESNDSARVQLVKFLRYEWKGNLDSILAQTRIAASYGLLQNLYTTALTEGFKDTLTNNPEKLNEPEGFKYKIYHYASLFKRNSFNLNETNNYVSSFKLYNNRGEIIYKAKPGFEETFRTIVFLWNSLSNYNKKVFEYMNNFLPRE